MVRSYRRHCRGLSEQWTGRCKQVACVVSIQYDPFDVEEVLIGFKDIAMCRVKVAVQPKVR